MGITQKMKKYPICDTDIWIKLCKLDKQNNVFESYKKIFFADAVIQELKNKKTDNTNEFGKAYDCLKILKDYYFELNLKEAKWFNEKDISVVKRLFLQHKINYDEEKGIFARDPNTGELVSLIYASIHNLEVILSDDSDTQRYKKRFPPIKLINLVDFLVELGLNRTEAIKIRREVSESVKMKEARNQLKTGGLKELTLLKDGLKCKKYM